MVNKDRLKPYIPLAISLLMGLVLFFLTEDFIVTVILLPLLHVIWFLSLIAQSIPQGVLWAIFIIIMLIITYKSLSKEQKPRLRIAQTTTANSGTVERWVLSLENAQTSSYSKWRLAQKLKRLTQELLSQIDEKEGVILDLDGLELPLEIRDYFEAKHPLHISFWDRLTRKSKGTDKALDLDPEVVLQHLKKRLDL